MAQGPQDWQYDGLPHGLIPNVKIWKPQLIRAKILQFLRCRDSLGRCRSKCKSGLSNLKPQHQE